jgi:pimeloyl-ACP methyl ester carboxylesterase
MLNQTMNMIVSLPATRNSAGYFLMLLFGICLILSEPSDLWAQAPDDLKAVSINLEDVEYPHPVSYMDMNIMGKDVRMAYMDVPPAGEANGQAVVLMHGLNFFGEYWAGTIEALRNEGFRVIVPDQIGFGRSSKPIIPYTFQKKVANTHKLLDKLGIDEAAIVGHSMGGMVATRFAFSYPETTTRLVLVNMIGKRDFRLVRPWQSTSEVYESELNRTYESVRQFVENYYVEWDPASEKYIRIHYGWTLSADWPRLAMVRALNRQMVYSQPVVYEFPHVQPKTLILSGREDGPDFADLARQTAEAIPDAELILLENVGHNPHLEASEQFYHELIRFLNSP